MPQAEQNVGVALCRQSSCSLLKSALQTAMTFVKRKFQISSLPDNTYGPVQGRNSPRSYSSFNCPEV